MSRFTVRALRRCLAGGAALVLWAGSALPASAHLAIRLDVRAPEAGQHVGTSTKAIVFAQAMLAGVDYVIFTTTIDGRPIDPASGAFAGRPAPSEIQVSTSREIPLRNLALGAHRLAVSYRPDVDEPTTETSVEFVVTSPRRRALPWVIATIAGLAAATVLLVRRRRRA